MDNVKHYGDLFPLDETICKECVHRLSRVIVPLDLEDFFLEEDLKEMNLEDEEEVMVEQHTCLKTNQDMDYLVQECNQFSKGRGAGLFQNTPYP